MKGLKGRAILQLPVADKEFIESFAASCNDWRRRSRTVCTSCFKEWWQSEVATGEHCPDCCCHPGLIRGYMLKGNGQACPQALCPSCGHRGDISRHDLAPVLDVVLRDNTERNWNSDKTCEHCGSRGCELHHFAPRAIFNDADSWPTAWLCTECHRLWHRAMRSAGGYSLPEDKRVGERPTYWYSS